MKPFLKWAGGKRSLLPKLTENLPVFKHYHEPFLGGGALFFELRKQGFDRMAFLTDVNERLIDTFQAVQAEPDRLLRALTYHRRGYISNAEAYYYRIRTAFNQNAEPAQFVFLNKTAFNGLYRVNSKGQFNAPWGKYVKPNIVDYEGIRDASRALNNTVVFPSHAFGANQWGWVPEACDLVYLDPPYFKTYAGYTNSRRTTRKATKNEKDFWFHEELARNANNLRKKGVHVMISNSDHPEIRELFSEWNIESVKGNRSISQNGAGRKPANDLLIRSW